MRFATFFVLFSAASVLAIPFKRDVDTVKADFATIDTQLTNLNDTITSFPSSGGTPAQLLAIHGAASALDSSVKRSTADILATAAFNYADGEFLIAKLADRFQITIYYVTLGIKGIADQLKGTELDGPEFTRGETLQAIKTLNTTFSALSDALIPKLPFVLVPAATKIKESIASDFALGIFLLN
ncbi:hypothetical protein PQX77_002039 [Marasmius sp. AFHP31]|nr:hypothetical protein PQX77_002039 [Marasmius sp. AFHP31]